MVMTALRDGASSGILKFFLLGLLAMAAGGLIFTDMGGFFRGGITNSDVAKAGKQNISLMQFDRTLRATLQRFNLTPQQAWKIGYVKEILKGEMRASLLQQEAVDLGLVVSNKIIAENIQDMIAPMVQPGQRPADVLEQVLRSQGMSEQQMVSSLRRDMYINFVSNGIQSGFLPISDILVQDIAQFEGETRDISFITFNHDDTQEVEKPDETVLQAFYEGTKEAYAKPETRKITAVLIDNEKIKETLEISEEELQDTYDRTIDHYRVGERRSIEQVILQDATQAEEVAKQVRDGKSLKDAAQAVTGNTTDLIPPRDMEKQGLLDELQEPVFSAKEKDILGPIESALGHHVVVLNKIKPEETTPFKDVKETIKNELSETRILDAQYDLAASVDDYLAAGENPEVIKEELGVEIQSFPFTTAFGVGEDDKATLTADFGADATSIIGEVFKLGEGEATQIIELADGRQAAFIADEVKPKTFIPFEDLKAELEDRWIKEAKSEANRKAVQTLIEAAAEDESGLAGLAKTNGKTVQKIEGITRQDRLKGPLSKADILQIYDAKPHTLFTLDLAGSIAIATVTNTEISDKVDAEKIASTKSALRQAQQKEAFDLYILSLGNKYSTRVNERLLESAYGPESQQY